MIIADTIFVNGKVATVDKQFSFQRSVAVKDGWIIEVGQDSDVKKHIGSDTRVIDLGGKLLMPGAHDAHTHGVSWGTTLASCNCGYPDVNTIDDLRAVLKARVQDLRPGEWLRGEGLNQDALEAVCGRRATRLDVDDVTPDNPVIIQDCTGHAAFANGKAMELAGITAQTPEPDGGAIGRLPNGEPDGMFYEAGGTCLVMSHVPLWTEEELRTSILTTQRILNENGYTSYTESTVGPANDLRESGRAGSRAIYIYRQLQDEGKLTCRVALGFYSGKNGFQSAELLEQQLDSFDFQRFDNPDWLKMDMVKIFCDGVPMGHHAWMLKDYLDAPGNHGHSNLGPQGASDEEQEAELHKMILIAHKHGYQLGIHAIGDRAVQACIDGFVKANQQYPGKHLRHYIIHAEMFGSNAQAKHAAHYHIGYSSQPGMGAYLTGDALYPSIGEHAYRSYQMKEIPDLGVMVVGGTDAICGPYPRWLDSVQYCVCRKSEITGQVTYPERAVSIEDAVRMFTINAAYQENREEITGSIEVGKAADIQVLDSDIFTMEQDKIAQARVLLTMVGGRIVFERS